MTNAELSEECEEISGHPFQRSPIKPLFGMTRAQWISTAALLTVLIVCGGLTMWIGG